MQTKGIRFSGSTLAVATLLASCVTSPPLDPWLSAIRAKGPETPSQYKRHFRRFLERSRVSDSQREALSALVEGPVLQGVERLRKEFELIPKSAPESRYLENAIACLKVAAAADGELRTILRPEQYNVFHEEFPSLGDWIELALEHITRRKDPRRQVP